jgi:hemolysin activation/secretion protein
MFNNKLIPFALLALSQSILAQQIPSAGTQLQQIPPTPIPQKAGPSVDFKPVAAPTPTATDNVKIIVGSLKITGSQAYSEDALLAVSMFKPGSELSLSDLRTVATKIAAFYHQTGYFLAQAYLPEQDIKNGVVTISVIEGRYGRINLNNQTKLSNYMANGLLDGLNKGDLVASAPLESRLLLLSDIPGVTVKSTLVPGTELGTSDLIVDIAPGRQVTGSIDTDNAGNRYTGENRLGATIYLNNPSGRGDVASLRALTSGPELMYARASYQTQFGKATGGIAYSYMEYALAREFESLQANGTAKTASVYGSYPLIRSRNNNLYAGLNYDAKTFQDKVNSTGSVIDKEVDVLLASLYGDHRDDFGVTAYSLTGSTGKINLQTPNQRSFDEATAQSNGRFNKLGFTASRLQYVTETISVYASINGQAASKNLDISEKIRLGGMYGVRAYPEGEAYGDEGYVLNMEARMLLPKFSEQMPGQMQLIAFVDTGTVTTNKNPWAAGPNRRTLSGAGVGLNWSATNNFIVKAYYARKLGNEAATSAPDASGRFWIQFVKYF